MTPRGHGSVVLLSSLRLIVLHSVCAVCNLCVSSYTVCVYGIILKHCKADRVLECLSGQNTWHDTLISPKSCGFFLLFRFNDCVFIFPNRNSFWSQPHFRKHRIWLNSRSLCKIKGSSDTDFATICVGLKCLACLWKGLGRRFRRYSGAASLWSRCLAIYKGRSSVARLWTGLADRFCHCSPGSPFCWFSGEDGQAEQT